MKVKKYTGGSLEKIREVIVGELGENAVIINIKKVSEKSGVLSLSKKDSYEVIAAVEEAVNVDKVTIDKLKPESLDDFMSTQKEHYRGLRNSIKMLDEKLASVDERVENITVKIDEIPQQPAAPQVQAAPAAPPPRNRLLDNIHEEWKRIVEESARKIAAGREPNEDDWHEALASILPTAGGIMFRKTASTAPDVYVFIGPTGVGKTTTLAKLAAKCVLGDNLNVGMISIDTFRVAAIDQLREYASLLGIEFEVAFSGDELHQQLRKFYEKDVVFIDTPGRSQFDQLGIKSISECLGKVSGLCVIMVVPANIRAEDAAAVHASYGSLNPSALIITKTDEASRCDGITKLLDMTKIPVLYLADGQRVPEDIHVASPGVIATMVMPYSKEGVEPVKFGGTANG